jgi:hypothetical protein
MAVLKRHDPFQPVLRRLRPNPQRPVGRVEIIGAQRAQLLTAQRRDAVPTRMAVAYLTIWSYCSAMRSHRIGRVIAGARPGHSSGSPYCM